MAELRIEVLERRNNFSLFKSRIASRGSFNIVNSKRKVRIDPSVAKNINKPQDLEQYRQGSSIVLPTMSGKEIRLTQLYKDVKFVGRTQDTTAAEDAEIKQIRKKLEQIKAETGSDTVTLQVGANSYKVSAIESTPGRPKSDFNFITEDGNRVGFVSHKDGSAPINSLVYKASAGAINSLQIFLVTNIVRTIKALQKEGLWVIGLDGNASTIIYDVNLVDATAIVMGSEGKGIRPLIKKTCDQVVSIPMSGNVESLNVSVATAVTLFEIKRQRERP